MGVESVIPNLFIIFNGAAMRKHLLALGVILALPPLRALVIGDVPKWK
jgi:hypothetical protein